MSHDETQTPDQWGPDGTFRLPGSPDPGVWINPTAYPDDRGGIFNYLIWHFHLEADGTRPWQGAGLGLHQLVSEDPLHLEPSVGCDGSAGIGPCPNHGWIRDGMWIPV